ncbi:MAG: hypothetical protein ACRDUV_25955 [Pseudonocardiaceae bacterium]
MQVLPLVHDDVVVGGDLLAGVFRHTQHDGPVLAGQETRRQHPLRDAERITRTRHHHALDTIQPYS